METLLFTPNGPFNLRDLKAAESQRVLMVLRDAALWLQKRGSSHWQDFVAGGEEIVARRFAEGQVFLAQHDGADAGCVVLQQHDAFWDDHSAAANAGWVHSLAVKRAYSGRGLGKALLGFVEKYSEAKGKEAVRLDVFDDNAKLKGWYVKMGYRELGLKPWQGKQIRLMEKRLAGR